MSPYIKGVGDLRNFSTLSGNFQAEKFVEHNITVKNNQAFSYGYGRLKRRFSKRRIIYYNNHEAFFQLELLSCTWGYTSKSWTRRLY